MIIRLYAFLRSFFAIIKYKLLKSNKKEVDMLLAFLLSTIFLAFMFILPVSSPITIVYIYPPKSELSVNKTFTVEVRISEAENIYGWEFKLKWNPNLLTLVEAVEGDFLKQRGDTFFAKKTNNTEGYIIVDCTLLGNISGVSGNGILATVKFYANMQGESILELRETTLIDTSENSVTHTTNYGEVIIRPLDIIEILKMPFPIITISIALIGIGCIFLWLFKFKKEKPTTAFPQISQWSIIEDDEKKVISLLKSAGGCLLQSNIADQLKFSKSKTSKLLRVMESKGKIQREQKGREKVVTLIEESKS